MKRILIYFGFAVLLAACNSSQRVVGAPEETIIKQGPEIAEDLTTRLKGMAGVRVLGGRGSAQVFIGGPSSINSGLAPLFILDGRPVGSYADLYSMVNTADIKRIEVLKNAIDIGIYGARGANGVIKVTTTN